MHLSPHQGRRAPSHDEGLASSRSEFAPLLPIWQKWLADTISSQVLDGSLNDGAFYEHAHGWYDGRQAGFTLGQLLSIYLRPDLVLHDQNALTEAIRRGLAFLIRRQRADGCLDLGGAYSPNEAGFPTTGLAMAYDRLKVKPTDVLADILPILEIFLKRAGEAILNGSAYTANHRWTAACAPLAALYKLWPDPRYQAKIDDYLADGLDCNSDGCWFEERSPNYNNVANIGVLTLADLLDRPELNEAVIRNGRFVLRCLQANNEVDSSFSHRQDRAEPNCRPSTYGVARRWAQLTGDGQFTSLAQHLLPTVQPLHEIVPLLFQLEDHPEAMTPACPIETNYREHFAATGLYRERRASSALTLAADLGGHFYDTVRDQWGGKRHSDDWLHLHHGGVVLQALHLAGAGLGNLQPSVLETANDGSVRLHGREKGWAHTLHFRPGSPVWPMTRDSSHNVTVQWLDDRIEIVIENESPVSLAAELRLWIRPGSRWSEGMGAEQEIEAGKTVSLCGGQPVRLSAADGSRIEIEGLPLSSHRMHIVHAQPIPSSIPHRCGCLTLGMVFPVRLKLSLLLSST